MPAAVQSCRRMHRKAVYSMQQKPMDASESNSAIWIVDEGSSGWPAQCASGLKTAHSMFRDISEISRALDDSFESAAEPIRSAILKHTCAELAGAKLFRSARYDPAHDCPDIPGLPSIALPLQLALERG